MARVLILFADGVGVGPRDPARNPFAAGAAPNLARRLGGLPFLEAMETGADPTRARGVDACLGVEGLPQSATGQGTLFTGRNAASHLGHHKGPYPGPKVRELVRTESLFGKAARAGKTVCLANGYPPEYADEIAARRRRHTATVEAALAGGARLRGLAELERGEAFSSAVTNRFLRERLGHTHLPEPSPEHAGRVLARLASEHDVTVYEYAATDHAGHRGTPDDAFRSVETLDRVLEAALEAAEAGTITYLVSDHGNVEDTSTSSHTRNPALFVRSGGAGPLPDSLQTIAADVLHHLGVA